MALQTSGPISLLDIQAEFGGAPPTGLTEYWRGASYVSVGTLAGDGAFQTLPLNPETPVLIPEVLQPIQASHFYGTQKDIIGNTGIITAPADNLTTNDYVDVALPIGVDLIRFFLVGGGGGSGGDDASHDGGEGGGGSIICGTIDTSWAGSIGLPRTLRFFIGRGGQAGYNNAGGNSVGAPFPKGGHGYPMNGITSNGGLWGTFLDTYGVTWDMAKGQYQSSYARSSRMVNFATTGNYTFQFTADNYVNIFIDNLEVANCSGLNDQALTDGGTFARSLANPLTRTVSVAAGLHKISFDMTNTGAQSAYGVRILNAGGTEIYNTREDYSSYKAYPCGGNGGYAGSDNTSGYGGGGGSATKLSIINASGVEYFIALAGGGGGGGGSGQSYHANVRKSANWATQGYSVVSYPAFTSGGEGEYVSHLNDGSSLIGSLVTDGGGGGGGGGGIVNSRMYMSDGAAAWVYSGFGGRTRRGHPGNYDSDADGGESGKSAVTGLGNLFADLTHRPTTTRFPARPTGTPISSVGVAFGAGWGGQNSDGVAGFAYVDWGVSTATSASTPMTITGSPVICGAFPFVTSALSAVSYSGPYDMPVPAVGTSFAVDGFGGGGNPGEGYSYSWTSISGPTVTFGSPTSYRTTATFPATSPGTTGTIRCIASDGSTSGYQDLTWLSIDDNIIIP